MFVDGLARPIIMELNVLVRVNLGAKADEL